MTGLVFVDTSALYAVHDRDDRRHAEASRSWNALLDHVAVGERTCVSHSGVVVEASALVQRRLGMDALRSLHDDTLPVVDVTWIDRGLHDRAVAATLAAGRRDVSLVDWTSFEVMRMRAIEVAFAYDDDFASQGFERWVAP